MKNYLNKLIINSYIEVDRITGQEAMKWDVSIYKEGSMNTLAKFYHEPTQDDLNMINSQLQTSYAAL
jgi:hypothetical protein